MFNPHITLVTTRVKVEAGEVANLTKLTGAELREIRQNGEYVVLLQDMNNSCKVSDRETFHRGEAQKWERRLLKVFYSLKEVENFLSNFYKKERFIINALPSGWKHDELDEFIKTLPNPLWM